jgi:hypothetical protein
VEGCRAARSRLSRCGPSFMRWPNLGNFLRTLATPEPIKDWSLTRLKKKLIKIGANGDEPRQLRRIHGMLER